jgi:hypothetical protein
MHDWKLGALAIATLPGWGYHESQHRPNTPKARRPRRSVVRRGIATILRLLASTATDVM